MSISNILPRREQGTVMNIIQGTVIGIVLTALSYAVGFNMGWVATLNWVEVFAVFTSYACTFLCVMERRVNYPIGAVSNAAYSYLFFTFGLYASAIVTGYLTLALAYGWFRWKSDDETKPVSRVEAKWIPAYVISTAAFYLGALAFVTAIGGTLAATDTVILIGTILAQFLLDNKKIENWAVWAVVNVFAIYTYFTAGLALAAFQYVFFLANTAYGYYTWKKTQKMTAAQPQAAPVMEAV